VVALWILFESQWEYFFYKFSSVRVRVRVMLSVDFSVEIATKVSDRLSHQLVSKSPSIVIMLRGLLTEHSDLEDKKR